MTSLAWCRGGALSLSGRCQDELSSNTPGGPSTHRPLADGLNLVLIDEAKIALAMAAGQFDAAEGPDERRFERSPLRGSLDRTLRRSAVIPPSGTFELPIESRSSRRGGVERLSGMRTSNEGSVIRTRSTLVPSEDTPMQSLEHFSIPYGVAAACAIMLDQAAGVQFHSGDVILLATAARGRGQMLLWLASSLTAA